MEYGLCIWRDNMGYGELIWDMVRWSGVWLCGMGDGGSVVWWSGMIMGVVWDISGEVVSGILGWCREEWCGMAGGMMYGCSLGYCEMVWDN